ncbi:hypothetical protein ABZP36_030574 [Zizania latifolia]
MQHCPGAGDDVEAATSTIQRSCTTAPGAAGFGTPTGTWCTSKPHIKQRYTKALGEHSSPHRSQTESSRKPVSQRLQTWADLLLYCGLARTCCALQMGAVSLGDQSLSWYLWVFVVIFLLLNVNGWHMYFWIAFLPLLLLAVGTKLEYVIAQLAHDVAEKNSAIEGDLVIKSSDDHFWLGRPKIDLYLTHFILFQNAFEIAFFFLILGHYPASLQLQHHASVCSCYSGSSGLGTEGQDEERTQRAATGASEPANSGDTARPSVKIEMMRWAAREGWLRSDK